MVDITRKKTVITEGGNAFVRILAGTYKGKSGVFESKYVKVTYLDVDLAPDSTWTYSETPNDETLFIYLLDGTLAIDEPLSGFEYKSCAILFRFENPDDKMNDTVVVRSGYHGAHFVYWQPNRYVYLWCGKVPL